MGCRCHSNRIAASGNEVNQTNHEPINQISLDFNLFYRLVNLVLAAEIVFFLRLLEAMLDMLGKSVLQSLEHQSQ